jgi:hypothetical protein
MDFFNNLGDEGIKLKIKDIDWKGRLYTPGLPPKPTFDTSLANQCYELAAKWEDEVSFSRLVILDLSPAPSYVIYTNHCYYFSPSNQAPKMSNPSLGIRSSSSLRRSSSRKL